MSSKSSKSSRPTLNRIISKFTHWERIHLKTKIKTIRERKNPYNKKLREMQLSIHPSQLMKISKKEEKEF